MIFKTKFVNDELYKKNGQKVKIINKIDDIFVTVKFEDSTIAEVYRSEIVEE